MRLMTHPLNAWNVFDAFNAAAEESTRMQVSVTAQTREKDIVLQADIPGVDPAKLDISLDGAILTLKGERTREEGEALVFERKFELPFAPAPEELKAAVRFGVLTLTIPKPAVPESRKIAVSVTE